MTINKPQRQSIDILGVYLPQPLFSHGQLYVALPSAGLLHKTKVIIIDVNVIKELFRTTMENALQTLFLLKN